MLLFFNLLELKVYLKNSFLTNLAKVHETTGHRLKSHSPQSVKICPTFSEELCHLQQLLLFIHSVGSFVSDTGCNVLLKPS